MNTTLATRCMKPTVEPIRCTKIYGFPVLKNRATEPNTTGCEAIKDAIRPTEESQVNVPFLVMIK